MEHYISVWYALLILHLAVSTMVEIKKKIEKIKKDVKTSNYQAQPYDNTLQTDTTLLFYLISSSIKRDSSSNQN